MDRELSRSSGMLSFSLDGLMSDWPTRVPFDVGASEEALESGGAVLAWCG